MAIDTNGLFLARRERERPTPKMPGKQKKAAKKPRTRIAASDRKEQIVLAAIELFAEKGFESSTHELAARIGVTQPLIYRHFPAKDDLVKAVYERVFLREWKQQWNSILSDRSKPLEDRLVSFYSDYTKKIFDTDWIRIYLFAGLKRLDINRWYMALVEERILSAIGAEIRITLGYPAVDAVPLTADEIEALWLAHGGIFYYGVRDGVYGIKPKVNSGRALELLAVMVVEGMRGILRNISPGK